MNLVNLLFEVRADGPADSRLEQDGFVFNPLNDALEPHAYVEVWTRGKGNIRSVKGRRYQLRIESTLLPSAYGSVPSGGARYEFVVGRITEEPSLQEHEVVLEPADDRLTDLSFVRLLFSDELLGFETSDSATINVAETVRFSVRDMPAFRHGETVLVSFSPIDN